MANSPIPLESCVPLSSLVNDRIRRGFSTSCDPAFVLNYDAMAGLTAQDATAPRVIHPWITPEHIDEPTARPPLWVILLPSSQDHNVTHQWSHTASPRRARSIFASVYPEIHRHLANHEAALRARAKSPRRWWENSPGSHPLDCEHAKIAWGGAERPNRFFLTQRRTVIAAPAGYIFASTPWIHTILNSSVAAALLRDSPLANPQSPVPTLQAVAALPFPIPQDQSIVLLEQLSHEISIAHSQNRDPDPRLQSRVDEAVIQAYLTPD